MIYNYYIENENGKVIKYFKNIKSAEEYRYDILKSVPGLIINIKHCEDVVVVDKHMIMGLYDIFKDNEFNFNFNNKHIIKSNRRIIEEINNFYHQEKSNQL